MSNVQRVFTADDLTAALDRAYQDNGTIVVSADDAEIIVAAAAAWEAMLGGTDVNISDEGVGITTAVPEGFYKTAFGE